MKTTRDLSTLALLVTVLLWASAFVGIRAVGDTYTPGSLSLGRLLVGAAVLTFFARPGRNPLPTGRPLLLVILYGVVWFGAYNIALNAAERDLDAGTTALIVNIGPAIAALVAGFLYREGFPKPLLIGMGIAFTGVVLIALSTDRDSTAVDTASTTGVLLCVAAAVFYAFGALAQKPALNHMEPVMSVWLGCLVGVVVCLPFAPTLIDELAGASFHDIAWLVYLGVFPTAIGFSTWSYALKRISTGQAASTTYLVPAVATAISWVVLDEVPAALAFVGGALCLTGVAITRLRPAAGTEMTHDEVMEIGDKVSWDTPQGRTHGTIVERKTKDFQLDGRTWRASDDEPKFVVESEKTGAKAAHEPSALRSLKS